MSLPANPSKAFAVAVRDGKLPTIRLEKQKWNPKVLSQKMKHMIALHSQGVRRDEIGIACDCTPEYVSMVVGTEAGQQYMHELERYMDSRMKTTFGKAVDVIHSSLDSADEDVALKAARLALEANGKLKPKDNGQRSAEDVAADILNKATLIMNSNVQIVQRS